MVSDKYYFQDFYTDPNRILVYDEKAEKIKKIFDLNSLSNAPEEFSNTDVLDINHFIVYNQDLFIFIKNSENGEMAVYKSKLDGTNLSMLTVIKNSYSILNSAASDNKLFFTSIIANEQNNGGSAILSLDLSDNTLKYIANKEEDFFKCPQIVDINEDTLYIREDITRKKPKSSFTYTDIYPSNPEWYVGFIDHTNLLSYKIKQDKTIVNNENLYFYSSAYCNQSIYYVDSDMHTVRKADWLTKKVTEINTTNEIKQFEPYFFGDNLMYVSLDSTPVKVGQSSKSFYSQLDTHTDTIRKIEFTDQTINYVCSYAKLQKGYVLYLEYRSNTPQVLAYVAKEDLYDFENKMVILDYNI